ncbi:MAG: hypothetical protein QGG64_27475 [Candidatus Latescibacteria bacterium]|jgi:hypothetical protein|nr:hypothetical protein [Candidatus Latescibacterota bacterium]
MSLFSIFFPREEREFRGDRWVSISLRTLHLIGLIGVGGGFLFQAEEAVWKPYWMLCAGSGVALICLYMWYSAIWLIQLRGLVILLKLGLLLCLPLFDGREVYVLILIVVLSGIISHAPGDVRYYSIFHGRRLESLD